jgi:hypothetical protein
MSAQHRIYGAKPCTDVDRPFQSSHHGSLAVYRIEPSKDELDLLQFLLFKRQDIYRILTNSQLPAKLQLSASVHLEKGPDDSRQTIDFYQNSKTVIITSAGVSDNDYFAMIESILAAIASFCSLGSGWTITGINYVDVKLAQFKQFSGSSFIPTPSFLNDTRCLLNIHNYDRRCFLYSYVAARYGNMLKAGNKEKFSADANIYKPFLSKIKGNYTMPMTTDQIDAFEHANKSNVNVYVLDEENLVPYRISKGNFAFTVDLLLLESNENRHYILIQKLNALVRKCQGIQNKNGALCRKCLHIFSNKHILAKHFENCQIKDSCIIQMPKGEKIFKRFTNYSSRQKLPIVVYFDLESLIVPIHYCQPSSSQSFTTKTEKHVVSGFSLAVIESNSASTRVEYGRGPNCLAIFFSHLRALAKKAYTEKRRYPIFTGTAIGSPVICWLCEQTFDEDADYVRDHCHFTGEFLGWAHNECNLARKIPNFIPIVAHNASNYDWHLLLEHLKVEGDEKISVIPVTDELYISFTLSVVVDNFIDDNGCMKKIYEHLRFIDSYRFTLTSLSNLAENLPKNKFSILEDYFIRQRNQDPNNVNLLKRKAFYPYSYITSFDTFDETQLPALSNWTDSLSGGAVKITQKDLDHAQLVFNIFKCATLGDYSDLYVITDTLILASAFEFFRETCYQNYGLDVLCYYSASNLSGAAFMKLTGATVELLSEREHLDFVERSIRGGICSSFTQRLFIPNNPSLPNYDPSEDTTYGFFADANSLYGGVMQEFPLPIRDYSFVELNLDDILNIPSDSEYGYLIEVDFFYPPEVFDLFRDCPPAAEKLPVQFEWLSDYQMSLLRKIGQIKPSAVPKLLNTLLPKRNYVTHYLMLQLLVKLGITVTRIGQALRFKQEKWLSPFIKFNSEKRKQALNKMEELFYKLISNSAYGKCMESKRKRLKVALCTNEMAAKKNCSKPNFKSFTIFTENLSAVTLSPLKIIWDVPTIVGACILEISKFYMFNFYFNIFKPQFPYSRLLYMDTDSFVLKVHCADLYGELTGIRQYFDFSNYPVDHPLFSRENQKTVLKFKDELSGEVMKEFIALKPKMYSTISGDNNKQKMSAKGVPRYTQNALLHEAYRDILVHSADVSRKDNGYLIRASKHLLYTTILNKVTLSVYDDKRFYNDSIMSEPYGMQMARKTLDIGKVFEI